MDIFKSKFVEHSKQIGYYFEAHIAPGKLLIDLEGGGTEKSMNLSHHNRDVGDTIPGIGNIRIQSIGGIVRERRSVV